MQDPTIDILKRNNLSVTEGRRNILQLFLNHNASALRHSDIESSLHGLDRVTIYRTLQAFTEKGIIHSIPGSDGAARYALCKGGCEQGHHHDDHVHFVCVRCGSTQCLDDVHVPYVRMPEGFEATKVEMVVSGICSKCRK
ncbi:MAG: transcriptional repressor [Chitinophagaceae bacterium]|jgi:Fur family ferric uptake transcriptional regulator|nr:transcriptional repressor [Chitinophagaceae bacterium]